ncbi:MAG: diguanylate cyclase [Acidimicrobiales bacterium]|nr:diguanylate cyclase [Acidimicrobiales bacterium]
MSASDESQSSAVGAATGFVDPTSSGDHHRPATAGVSLADVAPVGLLRADRDGRVDFDNAAWRDLCGLDRGESAGHGWLERLRPESGAMLLALVAEVASDGEVRTSDHQVLVAGDWRWTRWLINGIAGGAGAVVMAVTDVDQDHVEREALAFQALHDPLTGLVNRPQFFELIEHALRGHRRHPGLLAVLFLDIDDFKAVNDTHGHAWGDRVLVAISSALQAAVRPEDVLARIGGDEFAVMCDRLDDQTDAATIADRVRGALRDPMVIDGVVVDLGVSVGVAYANGAREAPEAILDRADRAMYQEKRRDASDADALSHSSA